MDWQQTELIFKQLEVYACSSHPRSLCPASLSDAFGATEQATVVDSVTTATSTGGLDGHGTQANAQD